jgi:hypothetical protein
MPFANKSILRCVGMLSLIVLWNACFSTARAQDETRWSELERPLNERLEKLRDVPDVQRIAEASSQESL